MVAAVQDAQDLDARLDGDLVFFTVSQSRGEQRKVVLAPHIDHTKTKVEIVFHKVCSRDGLRCCELQSSNTASDLDLLRLAVPARLASIAAWCKISRLTRPCLSNDVMRRMLDTSMFGVGPALDVVPIQDGIMGVLEAPDPLAKFADGASHADVVRCSGVVAELSRRGAWSHAGDPVGVFDLLADLAGLRSSDIDLMAETGVLQQSEDIFGGFSVSLVRGPLLSSEWVAQASSCDSLPLRSYSYWCGGVFSNIGCVVNRKRQL